MQIFEILKKNIPRKGYHMQMFNARVDVAPEDRVNTVLDLMNLEVFPSLPNPVILQFCCS